MTGADSNGFVVAAFLRGDIGKVITSELMFGSFVILKASKFDRNQSALFVLAAEVTVVDGIEPSVNQNPLGGFFIGSQIRECTIGHSNVLRRFPAVATKLKRVEGVGLAIATCKMKTLDDPMLCTDFELGFAADDDFARSRSTQRDRAIFRAVDSFDVQFHILVSSRRPNDRVAR